ncbi:DNA ligase [Lineolata rhizophorae]|uniref:DNA ligase n=1 Tax=Lineolata rhizophorae TaxID=578093 RepID=A0A6A6PCC9_9PEZI|nr:DNA ligase [Lineolata rhizophorae]
MRLSRPSGLVNSKLYFSLNFTLFKRPTDPLIRVSTSLSSGPAHCSSRHYRSRPWTLKMGPKQATLGYVKTQQMLGKFFGAPNGMKPAQPQQARLAFSKRSDPSTDTEQDDDSKNSEAEGDKDFPMEGIKEQPARSLELKKEDEDEHKGGLPRKRSASPKISRSTPESADGEDEPPTKRQRKRGETSAKRRTKVSTQTTRLEEPDGFSRTPLSLKEESDEPSDDTKIHKKPPIKVEYEDEVGKEIAESSGSQSEAGDEEAEASDEDEKPELAAKARESVQSTIQGSGKDPYPDWKSGDPVPYAALCTTFSKIEMTTKRLEILAHCSLFLRQVLRLTPEDLLPTVLLMINKLAADYAGIELGIGESLLMKAIGETTGRSLGVIKNDQNEIGDLGLVAAKSRSNQPTMFKPKPLTVRGVHEGLINIATIEGQGAQGRKIAGIKKLLSAADANLAGKGSKGVDITKDKGGPSEAKYIVRTLEGKLRLGLADKTVLVALAQAMVIHEITQKGNKVPSTEQLGKGESVLKSVYSEIPSYEVIIPIMLKHGIFNLRENCKLQPGIPLKPMLAKPTKSITEVLDRFEGKDFTCEYKYDGERAQIHFVAHNSPQEYATTVPSAGKNERGISNIFSRNSEDLSKKYPDILAKLPTWVKEGTQSFVLDCETVAWDVVEKKVLPFQQLMTRKRKDVKVEDVKVKVCVFAFDILFLNGEALVNKPFRERRELLHASFIPVEGEFAFATYSNINELEQIQTLLDESIAASCEGLMVKMLDGPSSSYEPSRRSQNWLKVKKDYLSGVGDSLDLVVLGAYYGKGKRTSWYGAFLLACYNPSTETFETVCNIGTGFSEAILETLHSELAEHVIDRPKPFYSHSTVPKDQPDVWFEPREVWEVKSADLTLSPRYRAAADDVLTSGEGTGKGVSLRFPRFIRRRDDKKPEEATSSRMVAEMYRKQESVSKNKGPAVDDEFEY